MTIVYWRSSEGISQNDGSGDGEEGLDLVVWMRWT